VKFRLCLVLHAVDGLFPNSGRTDGGIRWQLDAPQPFQHALGFIGDGADGGRLGPFGVQLVLHQSDELLTGLMWAVFVQDMVEVEEERAEVLNLFASLWVKRLAGVVVGVGQETEGDLLVLDWYP
jgi:hypothetical protein